MGMAGGAEKTGPVADPNIVPLIDVLLVLIIIFMVIAPKVPGIADLFLRQPHPPLSAPENPSTIVVQVIPGGKLMINRDPSDWNALGPRLSDIFKERAEKVAFVRGSDDVPFAEIAERLTSCVARGSCT